jgi:cell division protein FtsL
MWFFAALIILLIVFSLYIYFVSMSVVHVVMRKEVNQQIATLSSAVSQLESDYIDAQHAVSDRIASLDGFSKTDEKVFINRQSASLVLADDNAR